MHGFERAKREELGISFAEVNKFCKDHGLTPELLTAKEVDKMIKLMNMEKDKTEKLNSLDYDQF